MPSRCAPKAAAAFATLAVHPSKASAQDGPERIKYKVMTVPLTILRRCGSVKRLPELELPRLLVSYIDASSTARLKQWQKLSWRCA